MDNEKRLRAFTRQQILWALSSLLLASLDLFNGLRGVQFISFSERFTFVLKSFGVYLALVFVLGNVVYLAVGAIARILSREKDPGGLSLTIIFTFIFSAVLVHVSEVKLGVMSTKNFARTALFIALALGFGYAVSRGMQFFVHRYPRGVAVFSLAIFLAPFFLPRDSSRFAVQNKMPSAGEARHPNTILIVIDALREDYLHGYGGKDLVTPSFDRLASEGTVFHNVIAQSSWTKASVASLLSSSYTAGTGIYAEDTVLNESLAILPSLLLTHGITTAAFVGNPWLSSLYGFDRGYAFYAEEFFKLDKLFLVDFIFRRRLLERPTYLDGKEILGLAKKWIKEVPRRPFFVYIHLMDVHLPYVPPPPFDRMYVPEDIPLPDRERLREINDDFLNARSLPDSLTLELMRGLYLGEISYEDNLIGEFLAFLEEESLLDSTLLIVTADHGEEFMEHGGTTHAKTLYDEVLRVPLIMRYPPVFPKGLVIEDRAMLVDIAPTVLDIHGIEKPATFEGTSLLGAIRPTATREDQWDGGSALSELYFRGRVIQSVRHKDWKLIVNNITTSQNQTGIETELYNLGKDPREELDLSRDSLLVVERLSPLLPKVSREEGSRIGIPEELRERLESLGYMTQ